MIVANVHLIATFRGHIKYDKPGSARGPTSLETCLRPTERGDQGTQRALSKQQRSNRGKARQQPGTVAHHHRKTEWQATYGAAAIFGGWRQRGAGGIQWRRGEASHLVAQSANHA